MRDNSTVIGWSAPLAVAGLVTFGCGRDIDRLTVFPVEGTVVIDGRPVAGVMLGFHPVDLELAKQAVFSQATTDPAGRFELSTYLPGDGIPAGEYAVTASWRPVETSDSQEEHLDIKASVEELLDAQFIDPEVTPLRVHIEEGRNELPTFTLHLAKKRRRR